MKPIKFSKYYWVRRPIRGLCKTCERFAKPCKGSGGRVKGEKFWCLKYKQISKKKRRAE